MEAMTQSWTDDRIDDLAQRVDNGFAQVDRRFEQVQEEQRELRVSMARSNGELRLALERNSRESREELATASAELRGEIKAIGDGLNHRFDVLDSRFVDLQQILIRASLAGLFTLVAGIVTLIATQIS
ncbi:MAG TPA: hypothetical protein VF081_01945 [Solirubrobacterales bacterium]